MKWFSYHSTVKYLLSVLCFKLENTTVNSIYDVRASMGLNSSNINVYSFKGQINHYSQETISSFHLLQEHGALGQVLVDRHSMRCGPCFQELIAYQSRQMVEGDRNGEGQLLLTLINAVTGVCTKEKLSLRLRSQTQFPGRADTCVQQD